MADLPAPDSPVKNTVKPCLWLLDDLREREPLGDVEALVEAAAELGAGDVEHLLAGLGLVGRDVLGAVLDVDHLLERHHGDVELRGVLVHELLGVVGAVERLAVRVVAGTGVVAADDEVRAAVVLADDGVPHGLAGAGHAHGQVQQRERGGLLGVGLEHVLVAAHAGVVIDVAGLGEAHHRVDQQVGLGLAGRAEGEFLVGAVQGVARLEGDHLAPAELGEPRPELRRAVAQALEVVVGGGLDAVDPAADVDGAGVVHQVEDAGVGQVGGAEHRLRLARLVRGPDVADLEDRHEHALGVAQRHALAGLERAGEGLADVEGNRHRPEHARGEPHAGDDAVVVGAAEEALERGEGAVQQQLEVAELAVGEVPRRVAQRGLLLGLEGGALEVEVLEFAAVGGLVGSHRDIPLRELLMRVSGRP